MSRIDGDHVSDLNSVNFFTEIDFYEKEINRIKENISLRNSNDHSTSLRENTEIDYQKAVDLCTALISNTKNMFDDKLEIQEELDHVKHEYQDMLSRSGPNSEAHIKMTHINNLEE